MQRDASIWLGAVRASVGQASMQRVHEPQRSAESRAATSGGRRNDETDAAEQEPRPLLLMEDAGVLADPTDACPSGKAALDQRTGVDVAL